jgi:hypothetical protein
VEPNVAGNVKITPEQAAEPDLLSVHRPDPK